MRSILKAVLLGCALVAPLAFGQESAEEPEQAPMTEQVPMVEQAEQVSESEQVPGSEEPVDGQAQADSDPAAPASAVAERPKTKLGVLRLESSTGNEKESYEMTAEMIRKLNELGLYEMYYPEDIDKALSDTRIRTTNCRDPRCVYSVGKALGLRRMIYGTLDMAGSKVAVRLVLLNVVSGKPVETVSIEGALGVPAKDVLSIALDRVHGKKDAAPSVEKYYGPPVNNLREFLFSSIAVQGLGIFYSMINYGAGGDVTGSSAETVPGAYGTGETRSGIYASANQIPVFARPAALANAYTAVSDDAYGVLYNPAGMAWLKEREAVASYQYRFGFDIMAVSYANKAHRDLGFGQALLLTTDREGAMTEMHFVTAAGYKVNQDYVLGPLSVGAALKVMGNTVNKLSPDSPHGQSYGAGLDFGFMWELSNDIRYGLLFRDLPAVNKWKNRTTGSRYTEAHPPTLHMGGSYRASYAAFLTADGQIPLYADQPWLMAGGVEYEFFRMLALRMGLAREILDDISGSSDWWKITCGAGFKFDTGTMWGKNMTLDFSYEYNTLDMFNVVNVSVKANF